MTKKEQLISWLKELFRVGILAVVSYLLTEGVITSFVNIFMGVQLDMTFRLIIIGFITSALKALDRLLHDSGVAVKGIVRF